MCRKLYIAAVYHSVMHVLFSLSTQNETGATYFTASTPYVAVGTHCGCFNARYWGVLVLSEHVPTGTGSLQDRSSIGACLPSPLLFVGGVSSLLA